MSSVVGIAKVEESSRNTKEEVYSAVKRAMEYAGWKNYIKKNEETLLKVNMCWADYLLPGMCTSPWVLGAVIEVIQDYVGKIYIGEGLAAAFQSFKRGAKINRWDRVCREYGVRLVDLSKDEYVDVDLAELGIPFPVVISKKCLDVPNLITLPLMKTHSVVGFTGALKNQFGISFGKRIKYHLHLDQVIAGINKTVKPNFAVMDATIGMEGNGPADGIPKEKNLVLASGDLVALDATACRIMRINPESIGYIKLAGEIGLGTLNPEIAGDATVGEVSEMFVPAKPRGVYEKGMLPLLENPYLRKIAYDFLWIPGRLTIKLLRNFWYLKEGRKYKNKIMKDSRYAEQWK